MGSETFSCEAETRRHATRTGSVASQPGGGEEETQEEASGAMS